MGQREEALAGQWRRRLERKGDKPGWHEKPGTFKGQSKDSAVKALSTGVAEGN